MGLWGLAPLILNLGTRWKWAVSCTAQPHCNRKKPLGAHWIGDWVGPRVGVDTYKKREIVCPYRKSNHDSHCIPPELSLCTKSRLFITPNFTLYIYSLTYVEKCNDRVKVKLSVCSPWKYVVSGGKAPLILNFSMRQRLVVSFTHRPLYPWRTSPKYKSNIRLDKIQSRRSGRIRKEENRSSLQGTEPRSFSSKPHSLATIPTTRIEWEMILKDEFTTRY
jgi:hypothetical protein